ncbi:Rna polymerase i-specific transcription initiation factor rrn3 [Dirofilaria immitis]|nr:Rna polymerase i-specific transcription initiation factor rrn3 [Dirofilaria immitis]
MANLGDVDGLVTYNKLCKAIDFLNHWHSQAIIDFLRQFVDIAHLFDHRCKQLVLKFAQLEWQFIPSEIRPQFVKLLRDIGVQYICHTESIIRCFVGHLLAKIKSVSTIDQNQERNIAEFALCLTEEEQDNIYKLANDGLEFIVKCFPVTRLKLVNFKKYIAPRIYRFIKGNKSLVKIIHQRFPHHSVSSIRYVSYVKNLILVCQHIPHCRTDVFSIIIDGLAQLDAVLTKAENSNRREDNCSNGLNVFLLDEECEIKVNEVQNNNDKVKKLDACMCIMFDYVTRICGQGNPAGIGTELLAVFEEHLLMAHSLKNISFLWFYVCSLDTIYQKDFMSWLWSFVTRLNQAPNDWKKHKVLLVTLVACFLVLHILILAMEWLEMLSRWCTTYVNEMVDRTTAAIAGSIRHGTFYAVFQAFLVTFCFRYREIVQTQNMVKIHCWGLGHIVHSTLEPLSFISHPVALCFATISRSMQLVYVNHILPVKPAEMMPFEPNFPFDSYSLEKSLSFIAPLMRKFSPLAEDVSILKNELLWKNVIEAMDCHTYEEDNGSWEFLDDIRRDQIEFQEIEEKNPSVKIANEFLTVYSSSPGLKQFETSSFIGADR